MSAGRERTLPDRLAARGDAAACSPPLRPLSAMVVDVPAAGFVPPLE